MKSASKIERTGLEALAIRAVVILDVDALSGKPPDRHVGDAPSLVSRIVQDLNFEAIAWVIDPADRLNEAIGHVHLVVQGQLDRHDRSRIERRRGGRSLVPVFHVEINKVVPVPTVNREDNQDEEICGERQGFNRRHVLVAQSLILLLGLG